MEIQLYYGQSGLQKLKPYWLALESIAQNPNHSHSFIWWQVYLDELAINPDEICFIYIYENYEPVAICPLRKQVITRLGLIKSTVLNSIHDPNFLFPDIMVKEEYQYPGFLQEISRLLAQSMKWDLLVFGGVMGVLENSHLVSCLSQLPNARLFKEDEIGCFFVLMDDFESLQQRLSSKNRANLRRTTKKVYAYEDCLHQTITDKSEIGLALETFMEVEAAGWKGVTGKGTAIQSNPNLECFYEKLTDAYSAKEQCHVNLLSVEGKVIAAQFAFKLGDTVFMNKIGFNPDYNLLNPGNVLMGKQFERYCQDEQITKVNLMSSAGHLKKWAPELESSYRIYYCNNSIIGIGIASFFRLKPLFRRLKQCIRKIKYKK